MSMLIKNIQFQGKETSVYIKDNIISEIGKKQEADYVIDGKGKALLPGFVNTHTHAAMALFRSYAEDMELERWLTEKIWPLERKLTPEHVYWGAKLACLEMLKSGTTTFNDMYFFMENTAKAVSEMGLRAVLSYGFIDLFDKEKRDAEIKKTCSFIEHVKHMNCSRIIPALGPHAVYTVSEEALLWLKEYAEKNNLNIHFHLAETKKESEDFVKTHNERIVEYLNRIGFLSERVICAHCIWLSRKEIEIMKRKNVKISYNPVSNMKLGSGIMPYTKMKSLIVSLGTDGCASNNNLDMFESMKIGVLLQKLNNSTSMSAQEMFQIATINGARALNINAGEVREGKLADLIIIDLKRAELTPGHDIISDIVYSANGSCVDSVICDGKLVMENRKVQDEELILEKAKEAAFELVRETE